MSGALLPGLVLLPAVGGLLAWALGGRRPTASRWVSVAALGAALLLALAVGLRAVEGRWLARFEAPWIPRYNIRLSLGLDGLALVLVLLTFVLGLVAVLASWTSVRERVGFFHLNLLWVLAGVAGVFLARDLFLFYFCWELMLLPMALLIAIWGHEERRAAALKFFVFTQAGGLLLLLAVIGLAAAHARLAGTISFDLAELVRTPLEGPASTWLFLGFMAAFAVKLPMVPLHTWLADAHTQAPTGGSVVLAGLLLKTGGYGMLRVATPLFPGPARDLAPWLMALGAAGVLYGAWLAFAQTDLKRLVAYTSVSHLGFVLLGVFAGTRLAAQGAVLQMVCHGLSTGALFVVVGCLSDRLHTRDLRDLGGLWARAPVMGTLAMVFALASLGLPGLGNFVAELLVLLGAFRVAPATTVAATVGLVLSAAYALRMVQQTFHGEVRRGLEMADLGPREVAVLVALALALVWLGLAPQPVLDAAASSLEALLAAGTGV